MAEETKSSSAGEDTDTDGVQKRVEQEGREARNVISWRVPNELSTEPAASSRPPSSAAADESAAYGRPSAEPPQPAEKEDGNAASPPTSASGHSNAKYSTTSRPDNIVTTTSSSKGRGVVGKRAGKEGSGAGRAVAVEGAAMTKAAKDKQEEKEASRIRRFFSLLFRNLNRSVDELFWVCEAESSMDHSSEAAALLESCARDFHKLVERLEVQRRYEEEQAQLADDSAASDSQQPLQQQQRTPRGVSWEVRKATAADKEGYEPSALVRDALLERVSGGQQGQQGQESAAVEQSTTGAAVVEEEGESARGVLVEGEKGQGEEEEEQELEAAVGRGDVSEAEDDEDLEVAKATEEVWAEAERWVDDQVKAEEEAWRRMERRVDGGGDEPPECYYIDNSSSRGAGESSRRHLLDSLSGGTACSSSLLLSEEHDDEEEEQDILTQDPLSLMTPSPLFSSPSASPAHGRSSRSRAGLETIGSGGVAGDATEQSSPLDGGEEGSPLEAAARAGTGESGSLGSQRMGTGLRGGGSGKSLRERLSSPKRQKRLTPAEAKRRLEERQFHADLKRAVLDAERQNRLRQAAERVKGVVERRSQRQAQAGLEYEAKLGRAERRQRAHVLTIRARAENETSKVKEISFIQQLTTEALQHTLTERLREVEARIQAGRARRLEHLQGIKGKQRRTREKARQMSERRLEMEQMQAERWLALQARVAAVQRRRQQRLLEMQRRVEMAKEARKRQQQQQQQQQPPPPQSQPPPQQLVAPPLPLGQEEEKEGDGSSTAVVDLSASQDAGAVGSGSMEQSAGALAGAGGRPREPRASKKNKKRRKKVGSANASGSGGGSRDEDQELLTLPVAVGGDYEASASPSLHEATTSLSPDARKLRERLLRGAATDAADAGARAKVATARVPSLPPPTPVSSEEKEGAASVRRLDGLLQDLRACLPKDWGWGAVGANSTGNGKRRRRKKGGGSGGSDATTPPPNGDASAIAPSPHAAAAPTEPAARATDVPLNSLRALSQLLEAHKDSSDALLSHLANSPTALPLLVHLATPGTQQRAEGTALALHVLHLAMHAPSCRDRLFAGGGGGGAALVDAVACYAAAASEHAKGKPLPAPLAAGLSSSLSCLTLMVRHIVAAPALLPVQMDLVRYLLARGVVTQLGELLAFLRTAVVPSSSSSSLSKDGGGGGNSKQGKRGRERGKGKEQQQPQQQAGSEEQEGVRLLGKALSLLEAVAGFPASGPSYNGPAVFGDQEAIRESEPPEPPQEEDKGGGNDAAPHALRPAHPLCAAVVAAFAAAGPSLGNGLPTLATLLDERRGKEDKGHEKHEPLGAVLLSVAWLVLRTLNHLARLDLRRVQALLGSDALLSYWTYTHSVLLRQLAARLGGSGQGAAADGELEGCLEQLLVLLGYSVLTQQPQPHLQPPQQPHQQQQMSPLLLTRLATLPFRYWSSEVHKDVLFPTLLSLCYRHPENRALLANEISPELLVTYLEERQIQRSLATADHPAPYPPPPFKPTTTTASGKPLPAWKLLALRFPAAWWADAVRFFREQ